MNCPVSGQPCECVPISIKARTCISRAEDIRDHFREDTNCTGRAIGEAFGDRLERIKQERG